MSTGMRYLGLVTGVRLTLKGYRFATVEPLVESDRSGADWRGPIHDKAMRFPSRGLVHWHDAPPDVQERSLWQFGVQESAAGPNRPESFQCVDVMEPIEVVDLRAWDDEMALRTALTSDGVQLPRAPLARRLLIWLASGLCIGPLILRPAPDGHRWVLDTPEAPRDSAQMPTWKLDDGSVQKVDLAGARWFVAPNQNLEQSAGIQNWATDEQVARSILRRLRKLDKESARALQATDAVFEKYLEYLDLRSNIGKDDALERARADRLRGIRAIIERNTHLLEEAAEALLESRYVQPRLKQLAEKEGQRLLDEARAEIESELSAQRTTLQSLKAESQAHDRRLAQLHDEVSAKQQSVDQLEVELQMKVEAFDKELAVRLGDLAQRPHAVFAEHAILRAALQLSAPTPLANGRAPVPCPAQAVTASPNGEPRPTLLPDERALAQVLTQRCLVQGISLHAAFALYSTLAAGMTPLLIGEHAYDLVRTLASVVAGARVHWVPVGSSLLEPQDLLGRYEPMLARILPHAAGILDVVRDASESERLHVVVLEGCNRAPIEAYLLPILESAAASRTGDAARSIPIVSPALVADDDPYRDMSRVAWPANVLLTCIPAHGSATLPIPVDAWRYLSVIDADDRERPPLPPLSDSAGQDQQASATEITAGVWRNLGVGESPGDPERSGIQTIEHLRRDLNLSTSDIRSALAVHRSLLRTGLPATDAVAVAIACALVPRASVPKQRLEAALAARLPSGIIGWQSIYSELERFRD